MVLIVNYKSFILLTMFVIVCSDTNRDVKPSVAFVIDDTGSMDKVIDQVKEKAEDIFNVIYATKSSILGDFILVTFNDYENFNGEEVEVDFTRTPIKTWSSTRDPVIFLKNLNEITVGGGGECPEMCLSGIHAAIEKCTPNSYIYVFTDSSAKDIHLKRTIENFAQQKSVQINFLLTQGNSYCEIQDDGLYRDIAKATSGEVFRLHEQDISVILNYVLLRIQKPQTSLLTVPIQPGTSNISFSGDKDMKNLTVKVNCMDKGHVGVDLIGPDGNKATASNLVNFSNTKIFVLENPEPGPYQANIDSDSAGEASVKASVTINFLHGFTTFDSSPSSMKNTKSKPVPDEESYLAIQLLLTGTIDAKVESIHIKDLNDKEIISMPASVTNEKENIYASALFKPPSDMFKIMIVAVDLKTGEKFNRTSHTPIQPQARPPIRFKYKEPEVTIENKPKIDVKYGDTTKLVCKVNAYPKPDVVWEDKQNGEKLSSKVSILELPYEYISQLEIKNVTKDEVYKCKATSSRKTVITDEIEIKTFRPRFLKIVEAPKDTIIEYEKDYKVNCKIDAWPPGRVTWYRDDKELVNDPNFEISNDKSTLIIKNMSPELEGSYSCRATNDEIHEISYFTLTLSGVERPEFDKSDSTSTVEEGSIAFISCRIIKGWPVPKISWEFKKHDDNEFVSFPSSGLDVLIDSVKVDNSGIYRCHAKNILGQDYHDILVTVQCKPKIDKSESNVIAKLRERAIILCRIKQGIPKPTISWEFKRKGATDFIAISETEESLVLASASVENIGVYKCVAINMVGEDSHETELIVQHPPEINKSELTKTVNEASNIDISCSVIKGFPKPEVTWAFKGKDTNTFSSLPQTGEVIQINNAALINAGIYKCQASNLIGKDEHEVILQVHCIPEIDHSKSTITVKHGSIESIPCRITKGVPDPVITWKFKKFDMDNFVSLSGTGQQLKIYAANSKNMGLYRCIAINIVGEDSHETELIVQYPPIIEKVTKTKTATVGTKAVIECRILEGLPEPNIIWEFRRQDATEFVSFPETDREINLDPIEQDDAGVYKCIAKNKLGVDSHEIKLIVTNAPSVIVNKPVTVKIGEIVTISCEVNGEPYPNVRWIKDSKTIEANKKYTIFRDHSLRFVAKSGDEGNYTCEAKNSLGEDSKNATLQIYGPISIEPPAESHIDVDVGTDVKLPCKANAIPEPEINWHFFSMEPNIGPRYFQSEKELLTISKIQENDAGYYRCIADNGYETKAITYNVVVNVPVEIEKPDKTEFNIVKNDFVLKIPCKAKGSPKPTIYWLRNFKTKISTNYEHEIEDDGTLIIKNPSELSTGNYLCVAESIRTSAFQLFTVNFTSILSVSEPTYTIYVEADQSKEIECNLPHSTTDTIRWYKDGEEIPQVSNKFILTRATAFDAGIYSCRVNSFQGSKTAHMRIEIGAKPEFENKRDNVIIHTFIEARSSHLDCFAKGNPLPTITWWHNEIKLKESSSIYTIHELNDNHLGRYRCEATNEFGTITRTHVLKKVTGCTINYKEKGGNKFHPVLRTKPGKLAHFESKNGVMIIPDRESIESLCPDGIRKFYCVQNQMFLIDDTNTIGLEDRKIKYDYLKCDIEMEPSEENWFEDEPCTSDPESRLIQIGYKAREFSAVYDVCLNKRTHKRLFIKYNVPRSVSDFKIDSHTNDCHLQSNFNGDIGLKCCSNRPVVNPEDVSLDVQKTTYLDVNLLPQWNCSNYVNLDEVDRRIRLLAKSTPRKVVVFGGEFENQPLLSMKGRAIVPRYLWKVVTIRQIYKALAIVMINVPDLTKEEAKELERTICSNICSKINWMDNRQWDNIVDGYTFCCDPEEFAEKVNPSFKYLFPRNVLETV